MWKIQGKTPWVNRNLNAMNIEMNLNAVNISSLKCYTEDFSAESSTELISNILFKQMLNVHIQPSKTLKQKKNVIHLFREHSFRSFDNIHWPIFRSDSTISSVASTHQSAFLWGSTRIKHKVVAPKFPYTLLVSWPPPQKPLKPRLKQSISKWNIA